MIVFSIEEARENNVPYQKNCFMCRRVYWSTSRNSKYCCEECQQKAVIKINKRNKVRKARRKEYDANKEINRCLSKAYTLAHDVVNLYKVPKKCQCQRYGFTDECSGEFELHHEDGNPFNNAPWNLVYLCRHHHGMADDVHPEVNMVTTYNESKDYVGFDEEEDKPYKMIEYTKRKIEGTLNEGN